MPQPALSSRQLTPNLCLPAGLAGLLAIGLVGTAWLTAQMKRELVPQIAQEMQAAIARPVHLGPLQQVSLTGMRLGRSSIPATPTDADAVTVEAIEIRFNPIEAVRQKKLKLKVTLIRPQLLLDQDAAGNWLNTEIQLEGDDTVEVEQISLRQATVVLTPNVELAKTVAIPGAIERAVPVTWQQINGALTLSPADRLAFNLHGKTAANQRLRLQGEANFAAETFSAQLTAHRVSIAPIVPLLSLPVVAQSGTIDGQVSLQKHRDQPLQLRGSADLRGATVRAAGEPNPFSNVEAALRFAGQTIQIEQGYLQFGRIPFNVQGRIDLQQGLDLKAQVHAVDANALMQTFNLKLPFAVAGALRSDDIRVQGAFDQVIFSGTAEAAQPLQVDRIPFKAAKARFTLNKSTDQLSLQSIELLPASGGGVTANANLTLENDQAPLAIAVQVRDVSADTIAQVYGLPVSVELGRVHASAQVTGTTSDARVNGQWQLTQGDYPAAGTIAVADKKIRVNTKAQAFGGTLQAEGAFVEGDWHAQVQGENLQFAGGVVQVEGKLAQQNWQAQVRGINLQANALSPQLAGVVGGEMQFTGSVTDFSPQAVQAAGTLRLSQTPLLSEPLTADIEWQGDRLNIRRASTAGAAIAGWIKPDWNESAIEAMDLAVSLEAYDLASQLPKLPIALPDALKLAGQVSFDGRLTGTAAAPHLVGQLQLQDFALNRYRFEPLQGEIRLADGLQVSLAGKQDQIKGWVDRRFQSASVRVQADQAIAQGRYQNGYVWGTVQQLSVQQMGLFADQVPALKGIDGRVSARFNLSGLNAQPQGVAHVRITDPAIGRSPLADRPGHDQDSLTGTLDYRNGVAALTAGQLRLGSSQYRLTGTWMPGQAAQLAGNLAVDRGNLQDLWTVLDWINSSALSRPAALPELAALQGSFSAEVALQGSPQAGFTAAFDVNGDDWNWQQYGIQQISAKGQFSSKQLDLNLLRLQGLSYADANQSRQRQLDAQLSLTGQYAPDHQTGELQISKIPVAALKPWFNASLPVEGEINAAARIAGRLSAPKIDGELHLDQLRFQAIQLPAAQLNFAYQGDRLNLGSFNPEPGSVPPIAPDAAPDDSGARKIYFALGPIDFTLPVHALKTYADTGEIVYPLGFYAQFLDEQTLQRARSVLNQPLNTRQINVAEILSSPTGAAWLTWVGEFVQDHSGENGKASIQAAVIAAAAANPDRVTLMDVLHHYPVAKIRINTSAVRSLLRALPPDR